MRVFYIQMPLKDLVLINSFCAQFWWKYMYSEFKQLNFCFLIANSYFRLTILGVRKWNIKEIENKWIYFVI